jgi:membrane fusion protein (multidrug efflux system)
MNNMLQRLGGALAISTLLLGAGCIKSPFAKTEAKEDNKPEPAVPVEVAPVSRGPIEAVIRRSTHLEAESEVKVFARTANRVTSLLAEEGDRVEKNAVLLHMEDDVQENRFQKAQSNLEKTRAEFARSKALYDQNLISEQAFTDIQFQLRQNELAFEDAERELEYTQVRAPIGGTVTRRLVNTGDLVNINQHLFDIVDFDSIVARLHVPERELPRLAVGQKVRITSTSLPGRENTGFIQRIAPIVESRTGTVKATVAFKDVGPLLPGMYVDAEIVTATHDNALLLSKRALVYDGDQVFAYRLLTNRVVERLLVIPSIMDLGGDHVEPASGFAEGDLIVVAGQTGLKDGARVRLPGDPDPEDPDADDADDGSTDPAKAAGQTAGEEAPEQAASEEGKA